MTIDTTRLRELLASASSRPWRSRDHLVYFSNVEGGFSLCGCPVRAENAALIADGINALPALLDEVERNRWQPIATAPKDGSMFLAWVSAAHYGEDDEGRPFEKDCSTVDFACWRNVEGGEGYVDCMAAPHGDGYAATHWMPLPAAPALSDPTTNEGA